MEQDILLISKVTSRRYLYSDDSMMEDNDQVTDGCPSSKWCRLFKFVEKPPGMYTLKRVYMLEQVIN